MGCCASTGAPSINRQVDVISKSPPSPEEEEAVKEVLSETPNQRPISPNPYLYNLNAFVPKSPESLSSSNNGFLSVISALDSTPKKQIEISDTRIRVPRSPSPGRVGSDPVMRRERLKSPVKRSDSSPRRNGSGQVVRRREPGENSGRRSRSPAMRNETNMGRSSSGRKIGLSPGKIRMVGQNGIGPNGPNGGGRDSWERMDPTAPDESLENPLVSLECFIFL